MAIEFNKVVENFINKAKPERQYRISIFPKLHPELYKKHCALLKQTYDSLPDTIEFPCEKPKFEIGKDGEPAFVGMELGTCHFINPAKLRIWEEAYKAGCEWATS